MSYSVGFYRNGEGQNSRLPNGLTPKQDRFVKAYVRTGDIMAASEEAYPDAIRPEIVGHDAIRNPKVISSIKAIANSEGLTESKAIRSVKDSLDADNVVYDDFGREHRTTDHRTRLKGAELALRIHGHLKNDTNVLNVNLDKNDYKALADQFWASKPKELE